MKIISQIAFLSLSLAFIGTLTPLLAAKKPKEPSAELVYKYYGHPREFLEKAVKGFKSEFPHIFKDEFDQAMNRPYGSWHLHGIPNVDVAKGACLPFGDYQGPNNGLIQCEKGKFEFVTSGVYMVTFGIVESNKICKFDIQKKGKNEPAFKSIPGGTLIYKYTNGSSNSLTILVQIENGDQLKVVNTYTEAFKLSAQPHDQVFAYLSFHQIN